MSPDPQTGPPDAYRGRRVAPSILSADFARLGAQVAEVIDAGARVIHVDVMDGHFVPPITIGPLVAGAIADQVHDAGGAIDVHLMIERPERQIAEFASAGADSITIHAEATAHANRTLNAIREPGCLAGLALNPGTPATAVSELRGVADLVLCMTVNPGWGGQAFIAASPDKVTPARELLPEALLEVDGGIDADDGRARSPTPARPCSSPARRSSAPTTRRPPTARSPTRRGRGSRQSFICERSGPRRAAGALSAPASSCHQARSADATPGLETRAAHQSASRRRPPTASRSALVAA